MSRYFAVLEKEPESLWSVYFPDLPGCVAAADTPDAALANAAAALKEVVEDMTADGESLPKPRSIEELNTDRQAEWRWRRRAALSASPDFAGADISPPTEVDSGTGVCGPLGLRHSSALSCRKLLGSARSLAP